MQRPTRWMRGALALVALALAGAVAAWAASPVGRGLDRRSRRTVPARRQHPPAAARRRRARLSDARRHLRRVRRLPDHARPADEDRPGREKGLAAGRSARKTGSKSTRRPARPASATSRRRWPTARSAKRPKAGASKAAALGRWFKLGVKPVTAGSVLMLESEAKLPVELARRARTARRPDQARQSMPLESLPQVRLPYRMWRAPALDFIVNAGVTYQAVDRHAGSIATLRSCGRRNRPPVLRRACCRPTSKGRPQIAARPRLSLGSRRRPARPAQRHPFRGRRRRRACEPAARPASSGRGVEVTNRPLFNPVAFDRTRFEGDLPSGWDAELYRNGELLAFSRSDGSQRYAFRRCSAALRRQPVRNHPLRAAGPEAQPARDRSTSARTDVPAGKTWYWAGVSQPGRDLLGNFVDRDDGGADDAADDPQADLRPRSRSSMASTSAPRSALLARPCCSSDERLTFVEGSVRRSIGPALVEAAVARDSNGGMAGARAGCWPGSARSTSAPRRCWPMISSSMAASARSVSRRAAVARRAAQARPAASPGPWRRPLRRSRRRHRTARGRRPIVDQFQRLQPAPTCATTGNVRLGRTGRRRPTELEAGADRHRPDRRCPPARRRRRWEVQPQARFRSAELQRLLVGVATSADWEGGARL